MKYKVSRNKIAEKIQISLYGQGRDFDFDRLIKDLLAVKKPKCVHEYGVYQEGNKCVFCGKTEPKDNQASQKEGISCFPNRSTNDNYTSSKPRIEPLGEIEGINFSMGDMSLFAFSNKEDADKVYDKINQIITLLNSEKK